MVRGVGGLRGHPLFLVLLAIAGRGRFALRWPRHTQRLPNEAGLLYGLCRVSVLAAVVGFGIPRIIAAVPAQLINLPNKYYWLASERRAATAESLSSYSAWFGCALFLVMIFVFDYAIQFNSHPANPPDVSRLWYVLAGFLFSLILWLIRLFTRFGGLPANRFDLK